MSEGARGRFQLHLSTAVVLMSAVGILMWANVRQRDVWIGGSATPHDFEDVFNIRTVPEVEFYLRTSGNDVWQGTKNSLYGWPYTAMNSWQYVIIVEDRDVMANDRIDKNWRYKNIVSNVLVALAILFAAWFVCEWLIRRRAARKGT